MDNHFLTKSETERFFSIFHRMPIYTQSVCSENELEKYILYCIKSNKHINNLIRYIDNSGDFNEDFYRKKYLCGRKEIYKPIEHFARFGMYNKLLPNEDFDADKIYNLYPELKNTGIPPYILYTVLKIIKNKETSD